MRLFSIVVALASFAAACSPQGAPADKPAAAAAASAAGERFYDRESFTIRYAVTGSSKGEVVEHARAWGKQRVEIEDTATSIAGITVARKARTVYDAETIFVQDETTGEATITENPIYKEVVAAAKGSSGVEVGKRWLIAMGGRETGETGAFAGEPCAYWELPSLNAKSCVAAWGATLHMVVKLGPVSIERTATEVKLGDGGPDAAFAYDPASAKRLQSPDMSMEDARRAAEQGAEAMQQLEGLLKN